MWSLPMKVYSLGGNCDVSRLSQHRAVIVTERIFWGWRQACDQTKETREDFPEEVTPEA